MFDKLKEKIRQEKTLKELRQKNSAEFEEFNKQLKAACDEANLSYTVNPEHNGITLIHFSTLQPVKINYVGTRRFTGETVNLELENGFGIDREDNGLVYAMPGFSGYPIRKGNGVGNTIPFDDGKVLELIKMKWFLSKDRVIIDSESNSGNYTKSFDNFRDAINYLKNNNIFVND